MENKVENTRQLSLDMIRAFAIFFVIMVHCLEDFDSIYRDHLLKSFYSIVANLTFYVKNSGVPLFVMLSGALLLGREENIESFYMRRYKRLLIPFVIWSLIVYLCSPFKHNSPIDTLSTLDFFYRLFTNGVIGIYWYVYMTIGLYLVTPLLQRIFNNKDGRSEVYVRSAAWTLLLIYLFAYNFPELKTFRMFKCSMILFLTLYVWGYYIYKYLKNKSNYKKGSIFVFVLSSIALVLNIRLEICEMTSFQYIWSSSLFAILLIIKPESFHKIIQSFFTFVSKVSYGIYLMHFLIVSGIMRLIKLPPLFHPIVYPIATIIVCCVLFQLIEKSPLKKYLM